MGDYEEIGECCAACIEWKRDYNTVYGLCGDLQILTEEGFYCAHFVDKYPSEHNETSLEEELKNNPNFLDK